MTATHDHISSLLESYRELAAGLVDGLHPEWAEPIAPTIPIVGRRFAEGDNPRILIYGSAENLTGREEGDRGDRSRYEPPRAWNRHRDRFDSKDRAGCLGVAPYDQGGLMVAGALLLEWEGGGGQSLAPDGRAVTEKLAVANSSKWSLKLEDEERNRDVRSLHLRASLPFLLCDIRVLRPVVVLLAKPVRAEVAAPLAMAARAVGGVLVPTYQFHGRSFRSCDRIVEQADLLMTPSEEQRHAREQAEQRAAMLWSGFEPKRQPKNSGPFFRHLRMRYDDARNAAGALQG